MKALLLIDIQYDFLEGGSLEVPGGNQIIPVVNNLQSQFDLVVATQDWHPPEHLSFASNHEGKKPFEVTTLQGLEQVLWPDHCVQGSRGAEFHDSLLVNKMEAIFRKGMDPGIDSYSGFYDNGHLKSTGLAGYLRERDVTEVVIAGLAADYCVYFTLMDALKEGFHASLVEDATRPIDAEAFSKRKQEMIDKGAQIVQSGELVST